MAECYADYYTDRNKILVMLEYGDPKERQIALGSLVIHEKTTKDKNDFDLCWRIFLSDEHMDVKSQALSTACHFATTKQLWEIVRYVVENHTNINIHTYREHSRYTSMVLRKLLNRYKDKKL